MICFPNAKINIGLNIVSKRPDGYHNLETIFYPILIKDALEIIVREEQDNDSFFEAGLQIDAVPENNLVMKALRLMRKHYDFPTIEVHLLKKIPFGAGIGGGSADAAFMLKLLNETFKLGVSDKELVSLAVQLGADCPFFVYNRPMFATGVGEELKDVNFSLKGYTLVLIKPDVHIPTKDAFANIKPVQPFSSLLDLIQLPIEDWKGKIVNDFETSIFPKYPLIKEIKESLYERGALYASMTGSGSSVFGIFKNEVKDLENLYPDCFVWQGEGV
ncbi:4-(cytidine 5'-diphospho)-2-C-methyl-D-erythritol kinase [Dysgonomonas sp. Marseille-P4361]|uniref:4-(cytidine 5'-diphospho)-2-C-methyl-D-erythritol kinase n=1 Tax=Dysgonomonas sp. Marseille-P4361 TaxID=2161820 RepID=UPI000D552C13|nr:4-(cytidine 5'-diphospho)-2-C-methyl-D-erythritol kinase [Dysgonomonas sp. Marseille-P4361]